MKYRIVQKPFTYVMERDADSGGIEPNQEEGRESVIWKGEAESREDIKLDEIPRPFGDYEGYAPSEGNSEYTYRLEVEKDGGWENAGPLDSNMKAELEEAEEGEEGREGKRW
tara:strand:- start:245 stop:580 length:336 start_codon:yes stop_codon:yes gene_type:complete